MLGIISILVSLANFRTNSVVIVIFPFQLSPIEKYAMKFIEETESAWSAEQLAAAEREIEEQKREWEKNRLAAMREEEERRARELEEENDLITFSREDATNQVSTSKNKRVNNASSAKKFNKNRAMRNRQQMCNKSPRGNKIMKKIIPNKYPSDRSIAKAKLKRKFNRRRLTRRSAIKKDDTQTEESDNSQCSQSADDSVESHKFNGDTDSTENDESEDQSDGESRSYITKTPTNHVDTNSPRTRSRGTVAINLWTLDVSPILPGVKPVKNSPNHSAKRVKGSSVEKDMPKDGKSDDEVLSKSVGRPRRKAATRKKEDVVNHDESEETNDGEDKNDEKIEVDCENSLSDDKNNDGSVNNFIPKGKICKVVLNDIISGGQYTLSATPENAVSDSETLLENPAENNCAEISAEAVDESPSVADDDKVNDVGTEDKVETPSVNHNSESPQLDTSIEDSRNDSKGRPKVSLKNKKFATCVNNRTLDDWVTRSPVNKTSTFNSENSDDKFESTSESNESLKRTSSEAELNDADSSIQNKVIKTE